jgi:hypothetical protein
MLTFSILNITETNIKALARAFINIWDGINSFAVLGTVNIELLQRKLIKLFFRAVLGVQKN